jgi:hypothetical protein
MLRVFCFIEDDHRVKEDSAAKRTFDWAADNDTLLRVREGTEVDLMGGSPCGYISSLKYRIPTASHLIYVGPRIEETRMCVNAPEWVLAQQFYPMTLAQQLSLSHDFVISTNHSIRDGQTQR